MTNDRLHDSGHTAQEAVICPWAVSDPLYRQYHDVEWGCPLHDDRALFELLILEGMQAGLSWLTILRKRENFRRAFSEFDPGQVALFDEEKVAVLLGDPGIIRNRLKIRAAITNAQAFLRLQAEWGSFDRYVWSFVTGQPVINAPVSLADVPARTELSDRLSKDLIQRGFKFVGSTICYAFLQAAGLVNDHLVSCPCHPGFSGDTVSGQAGPDLRPR
ncbi:MAG: DNA-3-methyladenine glycosylase I [Eubacteriales bacterium]|nr:DNA-3-methyladenine glycosylase I [Eubacteriales bacterium]